MKKLFLLIIVCSFSSALIAQKTKTGKNIPTPPPHPILVMNDVPLPPIPPVPPVPLAPPIPPIPPVPQVQKF